MPKVKGAGRKPGAAWRGGTGKPRSKNAVSLLTSLDTNKREMSREALRRIIGTERDPLVILCNMVADPATPDDIRMRAAGICIPHLHPKLSAIAVHDASSRSDLGEGASDIVARLNDRLRRLAGPVLDAQLAQDEAQMERVEPAE